MWINSEVISLGVVYFSGLFFSEKPIDQPQAESRGFGEDISWKCLNDCFTEARNHRRPVMMIIHKSWCPACRALKPQVAGSTEIKNLSKQFVMVNLEDDEEPRDRKFAPDGSYIPRILFLNQKGELMPEYYNDVGNPKFKYFYPDSPSIARVMKRVLKTYGRRGGGGGDKKHDDDFVSDIYEDIYNEL